MKEKDFLFMNDEKKENGLSVHEVDGKTVITAPSGAVYLNEFMLTLPIGILNKKETGCGATTVVLENQENVIIACPTRQLIINKVSQYPNERCPYKLLAVQKGVGQNDIETYIKGCHGKQPIKIMVTYDSLPIVNVVIKQQLIECKIVVDEYQEILDACVYRSKAIRGLLQELKDLPNVTYLSATPIPYKFKPKELTELSEYEIEWKNTVKIRPFRIPSNHPFALAINIIKNYKMGHAFELCGCKVEEYFFFVNTVSAIKHIVEAAELTPEEVKIICGKNESNKNKLGKFPIEDATGKNKTFTFCTKAVFYGVDFHSQAGLAIILSDGNSKSSLLDVSTDIMQIAGRIRTKENPFQNVILHIYNTGIMCESRTEYEGRLKGKLEYAQRTIDAYQSLKADLRCSITGRIKVDDPEEFVIYNEEENRVEIDELKVAYAQYKFETIDDIYTNGISLREAYKKAGYNVDNAETWEHNIYNNVYFRMRDTNKFEVYYKKYSIEREKLPNFISDLAKDIELQYDIIPLAYKYLGDQRVKDLKYNEFKIRDYVHYNLPKTQAALKEELGVTFKEGNRYSFKEVKHQLDLCFQKLKIRLTAKANLLEDYFNVKRVKISSQSDTKRVDGFEIVKNLFFIYTTTKKISNFNS